MYYYHQFKSLEPVKADNLVLVDVWEAEISHNSQAEKYLFDCLEMNNNVILITANAGTKHFDRFIEKGLSVIRYPTTFFVNYYNYNDPNEPLLPTENFQYHFSCFNNNPKRFRAHLIDNLFKNNLDKISVITWRSGQATTNIFGNEPEYFDSSVAMCLDLEHRPNTRLTMREMRTPPAAYSKCAIDLVAESIYILSGADSIFLTEKTVKPLWHGRLFLSLGLPGLHRWIKELGFELYDEVFDYSFDSLKDPILRFRGYMSNVMKVSKMSLLELEQVYQNLDDKIKHNAKLARTIEYDFPEEFHDVSINRDSFFRFSEQDKLKYIRDVPIIHF